MEDLLVNLPGFGSDKMENIGFLPFLLLMLISFLSSMFIAYLYVTFYQARATGSQVHRAFPLIGISITAIFISIQFSLSLSLGLLVQRLNNSPPVYRNLKYPTPRQF